MSRAPTPSNNGKGTGTFRRSKAPTPGGPADPYLITDIEAQEAAASRALWKAIMLAPTLEICEALLKGQEVPRTALDPIWRKRLGA